MKTITKHLKGIVIFGFALLLSACSVTPQPTVKLDESLLSNNLKIGVVYIQPTDKATTHILGANCLLCYGVASALTSSLDTHLESTLTNEELDKIKALVLSEYASRSNQVKLVDLGMNIADLKDSDKGLGFATKDFTSLKQTMDLDLLVVLQIDQHGAYRSFSGYVPNTDPQGYVKGLLYAVDLNTNAYVQYLEINEKVQPSGEWDEPTAFPNVTMSYYQAIENVKHHIQQAI
ncbi:hypothetical protein [Photobacterium galatheae]|uniref:Lipoprotein n=1 Tax=Photobacterium galatheae TaxID=1654360 RepID=A0A066RX93_9GAMM|nr:hypothetical protein [Photobacterium galatheae]KDM92302.1 hypothetical protein EA58_07365 [Photobacterium galatheae]MCM0150517.1 hypothetical protein [Photobacterium galatheae]